MLYSVRIDRIEAVKHLRKLHTRRAAFGGQQVIVAAHNAPFHSPGHRRFGVAPDLGGVAEAVGRVRVAQRRSFADGDGPDV